MSDYVVGLTADGADVTGRTVFGDIGLDRLTQAGITWRLLPPLAPDAETLAGVDAVLSFAHMPFDAGTAALAPRLKHIARFGAGYDGIDPVGLAHEGVVVTTAPAAVREPLAVAAVALLLACATRLVENHRVAAGGHWASGRGQHRGQGIGGRTAGIVGFGSVGSRVAELLLAMGMTVIGNARSMDNIRARQLGVEMVDLPQLAARSDYVVVTAALTTDNHHLLGAEFLATMKPSAFLVNVARGALVDQQALTGALVQGRIAGAGLDVFDPEPPRPDDPLLGLDNVVLSPHALCWTRDFTEMVSACVIEAIIDVAHGRVPATALCPEELDVTGWRGVPGVL